MPLRLARVGQGRLVHRSFDIRWGLVTERLFWTTLIGLGIVGTLIFVGLFGVVVWGLFWGMSG